MISLLEELLTFSHMETNDIQLHVARAGEKDDPLVVLLHGFPEFWYGWRKQVTPLLEAGYQILIPDQRGYNLSQKPEEMNAYRIDELAKDVVGLCEALESETRYLVGHDWGAAVAWHIAEHYPTAFGKLAILNVPHPQVMISTLRKSLGQVGKSWYIFFFQIPWLPEKLLALNGYQAMWRMMVASSNPGSMTQADRDVYIRAWSQPGALTAMLNWYRAVFRQGIQDFLSPNESLATSISIPTMMLWGARDVALSREMAQPSIDLCLQGELHYFENATHWLQHDEAEAVNELLVEFFKWGE